MENFCHFRQFFLLIFLLFFKLFTSTFAFSFVVENNFCTTQGKDTMYIFDTVAQDPHFYSIKN